MTLALLVLADMWIPSGPQAPWKTQWSYEGVTGLEHWGELHPDYFVCKAGTAQSPIDIGNPEKAKLPAVRFEDKCGPLKYLMNNGKTIPVNYHDAPDSGNFLVVGDGRYQPTQFHFHHPSEERIHGRPYDMVIHFMHAASGGKLAGSLFS